MFLQCLTEVKRKHDLYHTESIAFLGSSRKRKVMLGKLNNFQIDRVLLSQTHGHLGCHASGETYVVPVAFVFESHGKEEFIYGYTLEGKKTGMMRENPQVCLQVEDIRSHAHWQSVILWGTYEELTGSEADHAIQILTSRLHPFIATETTRPAHSMDQAARHYDQGIRTVAYRIRISKKTGRFERK